MEPIEYLALSNMKKGCFVHRITRIRYCGGGIAQEDCVSRWPEAPGELVFGLAAHEAQQGEYVGVYLVDGWIPGLADVNHCVLFREGEKPHTWRHPYLKSVLKDKKEK